MIKIIVVFFIVFFWFYVSWFRFLDLHFIVDKPGKNF